MRDVKEGILAPAPSPARIVELVAAFRGARVLTAAVSLGVFDALAQGPGDAAGLAVRLRTEARATGILLDALAALGFVEKKGESYANSPVSQRYLVSGAPGGLASNLRYQELLAGAWADLPGAVRRGGPVRGLESLLANDEEFSRDYIRGMADISGRPARELAAGLELSGARDALDVGGGPGTYSLALLAKEPKLKVVLLDLPTTLRVTRELVRDSPHAGRLKLRAGNYHEADFGQEAFDIVLLSHVTHDEGEDENRLLLAKAHEALRPGGRVVIHDFMLDSSRTQPAFAALFSVHMLTYTRQGRTYSIEDYEDWLGEAGFRKPSGFDVCPEAENASRAVVAVKD